MSRLLAILIPAALMTSLLTAPATAVPQAVAPSPPRQVAASPSGPAAAVPRYADARVAGMSPIPRSVAAVTRIDPLRRRDRGPRRQADYLTLQVVVAQAHGAAIEGPLIRLDLDGRSRLLGSTVHLAPTTGALRASLRLTHRQRQQLTRQVRRGASRSAVAGSIRVLFLHYRDASAKRAIHEDVASVGARARNGGPHLDLPGPTATLSSSSAGVVVLANLTANPLVTMAGPNSCMYDSIYGSTYSGDHGSHLGTLNGVILAPGQTISAYVLNDTSDLDGREDNNSGQGVLDDYNDALNSAYVQANSESAQEVPELIIPAGDDESPWLDMDLSFGFFGRELIKEIVDEGGLWETYMAQAGEQAGVEEAELDELETFLETAATGAELFEEPVVELVLELITLFENSCMSHDGYMMVGATDQLHPWRQFMQVYDWGSAAPRVPAPGKQGFTSLANGIVGNLVTPDPLWLGDDLPYESSEPMTISGNPSYSYWRFTEADKPVNDPAVVSWAPGTRTVTCTPADPTTANPPPGTQPNVYDALPPNQVLRDFSGNAVAPTNNFMVGLHYISGDSTASVHYSEDGTTWNDVAVAPGKKSVTLPNDGKAVLTKCDVQVAELFSHATISGRTAIMGTRVASDIIIGPDYVRRPMPGPKPAPAGSYTMYAGPAGAASLTAAPEGVWWSGSGRAGLLNSTSGRVQRFDNTAVMMRAPDGSLWAPGGTSASPTFNRFDPKTFQTTSFPVQARNGIWRTTVGPDGRLWYLETSGYFGAFDPATESWVEYSLSLKNPESILVGPDGMIWITGDSSYMRFTPYGVPLGTYPMPPGADVAWTLGPAGNGELSAWSVSGTQNPQVTSIEAGAYSHWPIPGVDEAYPGLFDAQGNLWFRGQNGSQDTGANLNRMASGREFTQWALPYRSDTGSVLGTDGRVYVAGTSSDPRIMAISTGDGPAETPPSISSAFTGAPSHCAPASWSQTPSSVTHYWVDAATGKVLAAGDTFTPGNAMLGRSIQCVEQASLTWVTTPLTSTSDALTVHGGYAASGALLEQAGVNPLDLPRTIAAKGKTVLVNAPLLTNAGQRASVAVRAYRSGTARPAPTRAWTLQREAGTVAVSVHTRRALTFEVSVRAPRTATHAPLRVHRVYRVEPGLHPARKVR